MIDYLQQKLLNYPSSASYIGWNDWKTSNKKQFPFRYFLAEVVLAKIDGILYSLKNGVNYPVYYLSNRFVTHSHSLIADKKYIPRGQWADTDTRMFHCLFGALVDFVEIELASTMWRWNDKTYDLPKWKKYLPFRRSHRFPQAGIDRLNQDISLVMDEDWGIPKDDVSYGLPAPQAKNAREILDLYLWYTKIYPNRIDSFEASGYDDYLEDKKARGIEFLGDDPEENSQLRETVSAKLISIDEIYLNEETEMLIRLIKVRGSLWT
jgi:hypothetical protein